MTADIRTACANLRAEIAAVLEAVGAKKRREWSSAIKQHETTMTAAWEKRFTTVRQEFGDWLEKQT